jgi:hypothetical protein
MPVIYEIDQGDLGPPMAITLNEDGVATDVSGAIAISLRWYAPDGTTVEGQVVTVVDGPTGQLAYSWIAGQTAVPGRYRGQITVTRAFGQETFPSDGTYIQWYVHPPLP